MILISSKLISSSWMLQKNQNNKNNIISLTSISYIFHTQIIQGTKQNRTIFKNMKFFVHLFFSSGESMAEMVLRSLGSTKSIGRSPWSVRMFLLAPASSRTLENNKQDLVSFDQGWFSDRRARIIIFLGTCVSILAVAVPVSVLSQGNREKSSDYIQSTLANVCIC